MKQDEICRGFSAIAPAFEQFNFARDLMFAAARQFVNGANWMRFAPGSLRIEKPRPAKEIEPGVFEVTIPFTSLPSSEASE